MSLISSLLAGRSEDSLQTPMNLVAPWLSVSVMIWSSVRSLTTLARWSPGSSVRWPGWVSRIH